MIADIFAETLGARAAANQRNDAFEELILAIHPNNLTPSCAAYLNAPEHDPFLQEYATKWATVIDAWGPLDGPGAKAQKGLDKEGQV